MSAGATPPWGAGSARSIGDRLKRVRLLAFGLMWGSSPVNVQPDPAALAAQFGDLLEYMPDAIVLVNPGGQIVLTTKIAELLFG